MSLVAIQGTKGSYSEEAAFRLLGKEASLLECLDFEETFAAITSKRAEYAVVPVRNKIVGEIESATKLLNRSNLRIHEQLPLEVRHVLVGTPDSEFSSLESVRSHIEALRQCRRFLSENAGLTQVIGADTASSIRRIVEEGSATNGAIGSRRAAEIYGAKILHEDIADDIENWTTFYLIGI